MGGRLGPQDPECHCEWQAVTLGPEVSLWLPGWDPRTRSVTVSGRLGPQDPECHCGWQVGTPGPGVSLWVAGWDPRT